MSVLRSSSRHLKLDLNDACVERIAPEWEVLLQQVAYDGGQDAWFTMQTVLALPCYHLCPACQALSSSDLFVESTSCKL